MDKQINLAVRNILEIINALAFDLTNEEISKIADVLSDATLRIEKNHDITVNKNNGGTKE